MDSSSDLSAALDSARLPHFAEEREGGYVMLVHRERLALARYAGSFLPFEREERGEIVTRFTLTATEGMNITTSMHYLARQRAGA
ncbi:hypothetical protein [Streptomyces hydrogenans]|uniref:hypothetical protein n=1 Tax=Streptomyces hydrogenans TaxID=1873719 RepID=UPI00278C0F1F|nr:hypothetical protein [Streptomyces hydrogenans]